MGLVLASMFASTMGMTVSDINTLSAVVQRDIFPVLIKGFKEFSSRGKRSLIIARTITISLTSITIIVGINQERFGGVIGLVISWFAALVGPTAVPMILGMFPQFKHCTNRLAILSIMGGVFGFILTKMNLIAPDLVTAFPLIVTLIIYIGGSQINKARGVEIRPEVEELVQFLSKDESDGIGAKSKEAPAKV